MASPTNPTTPDDSEPRPPRCVSMAGGADYGGVSKRMLRDLINSGVIPAYRFGPKLVRVDLNDIDAAMVPYGGPADRARARRIAPPPPSTKARAAEVGGDLGDLGPSHESSSTTGQQHQEALHSMIPNVKRRSTY